jgi:hypothetical protein
VNLLISPAHNTTYIDMERRRNMKKYEETEIKEIDKGKG